MSSKSVVASMKVDAASEKVADAAQRACTNSSRVDGGYLISDTDMATLLGCLDVLDEARRDFAMAVAEKIQRYKSK